MSEFPPSASSRPTPPRAPSPPTCLSILLCDEVYFDPRLKKRVIVGTFNAITSGRFPFHHGRMQVLWTLSGGHGDYDVTVAIVSARTGDPVLETTKRFRLADPLGVIDAQVTIEGTPFEEPGKYWVELRANGEIVGQRPMHVLVTRPAGPPPSSPPPSPPPNPGPALLPPGEPPPVQGAPPAPPGPLSGPGPVQGGGL